MKKAIFLQKAFFTSFVLFVCVGAVSAQNQKPNIIVILADDMGYSDIGCMGSEIETPTLDNLAKEGVLFTNFYNTSRCTPSRGSLLTGLYGQQAGVGHLNEDWEYTSYQGRLASNAVTIAEALKPAGYRTIHVGKWHLGDEKDYWPNKRGFERMYAIPEGGGVYFWPPHPDAGQRSIYLNDTEVSPDPDTWYSTEAFTDNAMKFVEEAKTDNKPFFMYLAYIAPHFPLQAWPDDIAKYRNKYKVGYKAIRDARFEKQKQLGIVAESTEISPEDFKNWDNVADKDLQGLKMATYAAQIDNMDRNIARLIQKLKDLGQYDNTVIFFLSDNGAASVNHSTNVEATGTKDSYVSYGKDWANVSNTPYRRYKSEEHEGGIITPMIVHWPKGIANSGTITREPAHISDIMPTCLELTGASYPSEFNGQKTFPLAGKSMLPLIEGGKTDPNRVIGWEHEGNQAIRKGKWKLVNLYKKSWELYDLESDPTELHDLKADQPQVFQDMQEEFGQWKVQANVIQWPVKTAESYEFESFKVLANSGGSKVEEVFDANASQSKLVKVGAGKENEYAEFRFPVYVSGYYKITIGEMKTPSGGKYKLLINDKEVSAEIDQYAGSETANQVLLAEMYLDAQMATVKVVTTGKNASSSGYNINLDKVTMEYSRTESTYSNSEFEDMRVVRQSITGDVSVVSDADASGGKFAKITSNGPGEFIEYSINVEEAAKYKVVISHKTYSKRAMLKLYINDIQVGGIVDQYGDGQFEQVVVGEADIQQGTIKVKVEVAEKNPASTGYVLSLDKLELVKMDQVISSMEDGLVQKGIYPNPATNSVIISDFEASKVELIDLISRKSVMKLDNPSEVINVGHLQSGIYIMVLTEEGHVHYRRLRIK